MKICVVGGTGNISSSIVNELLKQNHEVVCFNRGKSNFLPKGVRLIKGDRSDTENFVKNIQLENFDAAIDMICFNAHQAKSSIKAFSNVKHFIMCSSVVTYGNKFKTFPIDENHPIRPYDDYGHNKAEADFIYMEEYKKNGFPITIIKPSTVYGPKFGLFRQVGSTDFSWIDRVRKGKPLIVCDDGNAKHQFLHSGDAALAFVGILGKKNCIGKNYILTTNEFVTWKEYHKIAMTVIGREVEIVGIPFSDLEVLNIPSFDLCRSIFSHHSHFSSKKIMDDVPEFRPKISLESGMRQVIDIMDKTNKIPNFEHVNYWEDQIIKSKKNGQPLKKVNKSFPFRIKKIFSKLKKNK
jgi:nucleoside-diphosphate-sugar epimerase|tara:strand:- start:864 stop:1919 length:1056 start_codon:yes stop_codon:yes gene_type:complete